MDTPSEYPSDRPSLTSLWAAAARAIGARESDVRVRNPDWFAEKLLGPDELALLGAHPMVAELAQPDADTIFPRSVLNPVRNMMVRTRFIDDRLEGAIRDGLAQLVILGAGLDSRAYRFAKLLAEVPVFELDQPTTQQIKRGRVAETLGKLPSNVTYVPVDFQHQEFSDALLKAGFSPNLRTLFIWEGVTVYLSGEVVRNTLRWIANNSVPGSTAVFDYVYESRIQSLRKFDFENPPETMKENAARFRHLTASEPWRFGLPDQGEMKFLREVGLDLRAVMGLNSLEAVQRYLTRRDGSIFGAYPALENPDWLALEAAVPA